MLVIGMLVVMMDDDESSDDDDCKRIRAVRVVVMVER